jgi:hypothetical protein
MLVSLEVFSWAFQPLVVFLLDPSLLLALRIQSQSPVFTMKNSDSNLTVSSFYFILHRDQSQGFVMRGSALPLSHSSYLFVSNNPSFLPGFDLWSFFFFLVFCHLCSAVIFWYVYMCIHYYLSAWDLLCFLILKVWLFINSAKLSVNIFSNANPLSFSYFSPSSTPIRDCCFLFPTEQSF